MRGSGRRTGVCIPYFSKQRNARSVSVVCVRVYLVQIALEEGKQTLVKRKVKVCVCLCIIFCIKKRSKILRSKSPHTATAALLN